MIREYTERDFAAMKRLHAKAGLPPNCLQDFSNPLFVVKLVSAKGAEIEQGVFLKLQGEAFLLIDHEAGTPEERWQTIAELAEQGFNRARALELQQVSAWLPPEIERRFGVRIKELGFVKSPWASYSKNLWEGEA